MITVTENVYNSLNDFTSLESFQVAAWEHRAKIKARQAIRIASGETDADFHQYDEVGSRCAEINQAAINWALTNSDLDTLARYQAKGQKLVVGEDRVTDNGGLWIPDQLFYEES